MTTMDKLTDLLSRASECFKHHGVAGGLAADIDEAILAHRRASQAAPAPKETCTRCMGNGEIVTDWDTYLHPPKDATEDAVADCPDCDGTGHVVAAPAPSDGLREENERLRGELDWIGNHMVMSMALNESDLIRAMKARARAALTPAPAQEGGE